jgi:hypothetical protein
MTHKGMRIRCQEGRDFQATIPAGLTFQATDGEGDDWVVGIEVDEEGIKVGRGGSTRFASVRTSRA